MLQRSLYTWHSHGSGIRTLIPIFGSLVHFRIGRKKTVITYMILGGTACIVVSLIPAGTERRESNTTAKKNIMKLVKLQNVVAKCCKAWKI